MWQPGLILMALLTATNLFSTRSQGEFEFWFASIKVAAIIVFIVVAASYRFGLTSTGISFGNRTADARAGDSARRESAVRDGRRSLLFCAQASEQ